MVLFFSLQQAKEAWQMGTYNATAHSPSRIREMLVASCETNKWKLIDGAYRIKRFIVIRYLQGYFNNLAYGTIAALLDNMILEGVLFSECENDSHYVRIKKS